MTSFYGGLLGLKEVAPPDSLLEMRLLWFSAGPGRELHFFPSAETTSANRHFCLEVIDVAMTREALAAAGYEPVDEIPIPGRPRFFCRDPAGNRVEFTTIERAP
jgi:catechol 2,3-dioxygenase-like lactoylglutathione lyase family enzyme